MPEDAWDGRADEVRTARLGQTTVVVAFVRSPIALRLGDVRVSMLLTNDPELVSGVPPGARVLGPAEIGELVDARPQVRRRVPSVLGVCELPALDPELRALARVFVPTRAYSRALDVLERHRFAVLTGPPEMGKTAIARMIGVALATEGWEVRECIRPDELWSAFRRDRAQLFVADDAFGSTEYRPDAAERWALDLDRVLRALDDRHLLIWTSRPAPLKAGLRRIHREHGVERWPQPAEVQVAASALDVEEKALILFRHAQAAALSQRAVGLATAYGWQIVSHAHFTPERIRRFVTDRLPTLRDDVAAAVDAEIREPTVAMRASLRALGPEHRALLVALLDVPPGPVPERELAHAVRRHSDTGFPKPPAELVDRLTDHFLRLVPPTSVTWVHPSWRDLVIEELAADPLARRRFLERCSLDGLLLALSVGGGASGTRRYPLLVDDADWDTADDRLYALVPELEDGELFRLLAALRALEPVGEVAALAEMVLDAVRRRWDRERAVISPSLLDAWFAAAAWLPEAPVPPQLGRTWIELLPTIPPDLDSRTELALLDDWLRLDEVLRRYGQLETFEDRERHDTVRALVIRYAEAARTGVVEPVAPDLLGQVLMRLGHTGLSLEVAPPQPAAAAPRRPVVPSDRKLVTRILLDLRPAAA